MTNIFDEHESFEVDCPYSLPLWIWGSALFIAGYMVLQMQTLAA